MNREERIVGRVVLGMAEWGRFEGLLRNHDWTYNYSDDGRALRDGKREAEEIDRVARELVLVDADRTVALYNKYGKLGLGGEWRVVGADRWVDKNRQDVLVLGSHRELEREVLRFGKAFGRVVRWGWEGNDRRVAPRFVMVIRGGDGIEWKVELMEVMGGSAIRVYREGVYVMYRSFQSKYYRLPGGGLTEVVVRGALEDIHREILRRDWRERREW